MDVMKKLVGGLAALLFAACGAAVTPAGPTMSMAEYTRITQGLPCDQLAGIVGGAGRVEAESGTGDLHTVAYAWNGEGSTGANASVTCQGSPLVVVLKAQAGLR